MDDVNDLVVTPFRDMVEKGRTAVENAGDDKPMLKAAQALVKEGERALKRIEPLCRKHLDEYGSNFVDALKENGMLPTYPAARQASPPTGHIADFDPRRYRRLSHGIDRSPLGV